MHWTETFFTDHYRRIGLETRMDAGEAEAKLIRKQLRLRKGMRVLDLCCGIGRHSVPLAGLGLEVTGADITESYLRRARVLAGKNGVKARFVKKDMRDLDYDKEFHAVVNLYTSFGYYDDRTNLRVLEGVARALRPGGRFLIDVINRDAVLKNDTSWLVQESGRDLVLDYHRFDPLNSRMKTKWRMVRKNKVIEMGGFDLRLYSVHELKNMIQEAGMKVDAVYGGLKFPPFEVHSRRMVISCLVSP